MPISTISNAPISSRASAVSTHTFNNSKRHKRHKSTKNSKSKRQTVARTKSSVPRQETDPVNLQKQDIIQLHEHLSPGTLSKYGLDNPREGNQPLTDVISNNQSKFNGNLDRPSVHMPKPTNDHSKSKRQANKQPTRNKSQILDLIQQERQDQPPPHIPQTNVYIHDKYAVKYSANQVDLLLKRSGVNGRLCALNFWLVFIMFATIVDYLRYDNLLFRDSSYEIVNALDLGLVSSLKSGKYGWPILAIILLVIIGAILTGLSSKNHITVTVTSAVVFGCEIILVLISLSKLSKPNDVVGLFYEGDIPFFGRVNIALVAFMSISWIVWHATESTLLTHYVRRIARGDVPNSSYIDASTLKENPA